MPTPSISSQQANLEGLRQLADQAGENDKIRGNSKTGTLYSSGKPVKNSKLPGLKGLYESRHTTKQRSARSFITGALDNIAGQFPKDQQHRIATALFKLESDMVGSTGELRGAKFKAFVGRVEDLVESELENQASQLSNSGSYNERAARQNGEPFGGTPIAFLGVEKEVQSLTRWKDRPFTLTISNQDETRTLFEPVPDDQRKDFDNRAMLKDVLTNMNELMGQRNPGDLDNKATVLSDFDGHGKEKAQLEPFGADQTRVDGGRNQDVLMLKFTSKEYSGWAMMPLYKAVTDIGLMPMKGPKPLDQVDSCHINVIGDGNFNVTSKVTIDLTDRSSRQSLGSVDVSLITHVNSKTGETEIEVQLSDLAFANGVSVEKKSEILDALSQPLKGSREASE